MRNPAHDTPQASSTGRALHATFFLISFLLRSVPFASKFSKNRLSTLQFVCNSLAGCSPCNAENNAVYVRMFLFNALENSVFGKNAEVVRSGRRGAFRFISVVAKRLRSWKSRLRAGFKVVPQKRVRAAKGSSSCRLFFW